MGIDNPVKSSDRAYQNSRALTEPLVDSILNRTGEPEDMQDVQTLARTTRNKISKENDDHSLMELSSIKKQISCPKLLRCLELNKEPGASVWLVATPYRHLGFELHQLEFVDSVGLRYGFELKDMKSKCICGKQNSGDHA